MPDLANRSDSGYLDYLRAVARHSFWVTATSFFEALDRLSRYKCPDAKRHLIESLDGYWQAARNYWEIWQGDYSIHA